MFDKRKLPVPKRKSSQSEFICDVFDGSLYKKIRDKYKSHDENSEEEDIYTELINTDGISLCSKSNLTIWPIYLVILEINSCERYFIDNILIIGI